MPDEEIIEERRVKMKGNKKKEDGDSSRIANPEDDTTDTWNRHYQISEKEGEQ